MAKIEVLNYKTDNVIGALCIMQSKGATLGNPYYKTAKTSPNFREKSIAQFRQYLWLEMQKPGSKIRKEIERLTVNYLKNKNIRLYCCCAPLPCHGDVIKKAIIWLSTEVENKRKEITSCNV